MKQCMPTRKGARRQDPRAASPSDMRRSSVPLSVRPAVIWAPVIAVAVIAGRGVSVAVSGAVWIVGAAIGIAVAVAESGAGREAKPEAGQAPAVAAPPTVAAPAVAAAPAGTSPPEASAAPASEAAAEPSAAEPGTPKP